tara:strand:+ start:8137 stop:8415 length:279 start_codon:yes stop_codon:yes gene_type:complete
MIDVADDVDIFLSDFAQTVTYSGGSIVGILDEGSIETAFVDSIQPTFKARTSELIAAARGTLITKSDGKIFKIVTMPPDDSTGLITVDLERQ